MKHNIVNDENRLREAVSESRSIREALKRLGLAPAGGNYQTIKKAFARFEIDTSHFVGRGWLKGRNHDFRTRPLEEYLVKGKYTSSHKIRKRLLAEGVKEHRCEHCGLEEWFDQPTPLELHHLDGDNCNNLLSNLELRCPNCHALTDNYRGKVKKCRD